MLNLRSWFHFKIKKKKINRKQLTSNWTQEKRITFTDYNFNVSSAVIFPDNFNNIMYTL